MLSTNGVPNGTSNGTPNGKAKSYDTVAAEADEQEGKMSVKASTEETCISAETKDSAEAPRTPRPQDGRPRCKLELNVELARN